MKKVNILGTVYEIKHDDDLVNDGLDGVCREYSKEIKIRKAESMLGDKDTSTEKVNRYKEVMRHELIHAFFSEAGLDDYSNNEQLVNWIAIQFPKMTEVFMEVDCL